MFKRLRSGNTGGNSSSATATSRYNGGMAQNAHRRIEQQLRNVQLDKRLNELKAAQNQNNSHQSSQIMDKYANKHQASHTNDRVINSKVNKSGELNTNFQRVLHQEKSSAHTQRNRNSHANATNTSNGRNTAKHSVSGANTSMGTSSGYLHPSYTKSISNKNNISNMTAKIIGEHNERQYEKENNMHRMSHKQPSGDAGSKRNKTSENTQRNSQNHSRVGTHTHISMVP